MPPRPSRIGIFLAALLPLVACGVPEQWDLLADGPVMLDGPVMASDLTGGGPKDLTDKPTCVEDSGCAGDMIRPDMIVSPGVVYRFWGSSANDVWAVGKGALTMHWNGTAWRRTVNPAKGDLWAVWGTSATNVWAVGDNATIVHWDGTAWTAVTGPPIAGSYNDIWGTAANDAWAVGDNGSIVRWNGTSWSLFSTTYLNGFMAVWAAATDDVWLGGEAGLVLHWDGTKLEEVVTGIGDVVWRIRGTSAGSVYLLADPTSGIFGTGSVLTWNGTRFAKVSGGYSAAEIFVVSDRNVWAVTGGKTGTMPSSGIAYNWNGTTWVYNSLPTYNIPTAIWVTGTDGWVGTNMGQLLHFNGTSWTSSW